MKMYSIRIIGGHYDGQYISNHHTHTHQVNQSTTKSKDSRL